MQESVQLHIQYGYEQPAAQGLLSRFTLWLSGFREGRVEAIKQVGDPVSGFSVAVLLHFEPVIPFMKSTQQWDLVHDWNGRLYNMPPEGIELFMKKVNSNMPVGSWVTLE